MSANTTTETAYYGLDAEEILNVSLLSEAIFVSSIFFTVGIFHYSQNYEHRSLYFNCFYKTLSITMTLISFFLMLTAITYGVQKNNDNLHLSIIAVFACLLITIIIANVVGMMDYRYGCWHAACPKLVHFHPNSCCKIILIISLMFAIVTLSALTYDSNTGQTAENCMVMAVVLSGLLSICNWISLMLTLSILLCISFGIIWNHMEHSIDESHITKFLLYTFPLILCITLMYTVVCCRNRASNTVHFRKHAGFNVLSAMCSILNRATNVMVFLLFLIDSNQTGWAGIFQLFLIVLTATISTVFVQYNPPILLRRANVDCNMLEHDAVIHSNDTTRSLRRYFILGKVFTFFGWGLIWFDMITWNKNLQREAVVYSYRSIKVYELCFECLPSLALQTILYLHVYAHQTVLLSIVITIVYSTLIVAGIVYDEIYLFSHQKARASSSSSSASRSSSKSNTSHSMQNAVIQMSHNQSSSSTEHRDQVVNRNANQPMDAPLAVRVAMAATSNSVAHKHSVPDTHSVINLIGDVSDELDNGDAAGGATQSRCIQLKCVRNWVVIVGAVVFVWSDFLMRIIPLWLFTMDQQFVLIYVILLWTIDLVLYWRMIANAEAQKLNKCLDILLFAWSGIVSGAYYSLSAMNIQYIQSVVDVKTLSIEYWLRLLMSVVIMAMSDFLVSTGLGKIFIVAVFCNVVCGYQIYFKCCCKQRNIQRQLNVFST